MSQKFRYDINGLRAYAVALVVLFHFGVVGFSGGFIGVDIFFVISGFLMTSIIVKGLENKTFNFLKFYLSRANRIIPALASLCAVVGLVAWFSLTPEELKNYSKHAITSLGFISNIQYFREAGYFDAASHEKLLLHTWSLSVEWQFYILLPIFLFFTYHIKQSKNSFKIAIIGLFSISLILALYLTPKIPTASFFLLPTRAWEMLAGGLIFLFFDKINLTQQRSLIIELIGFFLIAISVFSFTGTTLWPSYNAVLPVIGTFLILLASNQNSVLTNNKISQFLGNTSYSIYLWHWPLVYYLNYVEKSNSIPWVTGAILLSIFLGWLSYKYIENTSRSFLSKLNLFKGYIITFTYIIIPITIFGFIFIKNGISNRLPDKVQKIVIDGTKKNPRFKECHPSSGLNLPECLYGKGEIKLLVIGDSHAESMMTAIEQALPTGVAALDWSYSGCPTVSNIKKINTPDFKCSEAISIFLEKSKSTYPNAKILIINRVNVLFHGAPDGDPTIEKPIRYIDKPFKSYNMEYHQAMKAAYIETLCNFAKTHSVYVTRPIPEFPVHVPNILSHRALINSNERITLPKSSYLKRSQLAFEAQNEAHKKCGVKILDTSKYFCNNNICYSDKNGIPLYFDDDHLNILGANQLLPIFKSIFK